MFGNDISKILENAQASRKFYCILDGLENVENELGGVSARRFYLAIESEDNLPFVDFFNETMEIILDDVRNDVYECVHFAFLNTDFTMIFGDTLK